jgi:hypothetical protein
MGAKEIIISDKFAKELKLDPDDERTRKIEAKLMSLEVEKTGKIHGIRSIRSSGAQHLPPNSGVIKVEQIPLIIVAETSEKIVIFDKVRS